MPSCVNHPDAKVTAYCQSCGKALCSECVRNAAGMTVCDQCLAQWQWVGNAFSQKQGPNPAAAAVLGLIPGVGAMYNGQLFKGLIHVVIFAVLVSITDHYPIFGLFIAGWVLYQSFEAFHTAKARRDGLPIPDPFGLNELGSWLNVGNTTRGQQGPGAPAPGVYPPAGFGAGPGQPPYSGPVQPPPAGAGGFPEPSAAGVHADPAVPVTPANPVNPLDPAVPPVSAEPVNPSYTQSSPYGSPYAGNWTPGSYPPGAYPPPYGAPYSPGAVPPGSYPPGVVPPGVIPPIPPLPPEPAAFWRRREPVWAIVLIALGIIFLLQSMGVVADMFHYAWPVLLIGLGVWLIMRRINYPNGGSK